MLFRDVASNENIYLHLLHNRLRVVRFSTKRRMLLNSLRRKIGYESPTTRTTPTMIRRVGMQHGGIHESLNLRSSHTGTTESLKTS